MKKKNNKNIVDHKPVVRSLSDLTREYAMPNKVRSILGSLIGIEHAAHHKNSEREYDYLPKNYKLDTKSANRRLSCLKAKSNESPMTLQSQQQLSINIKTIPSTGSPDSNLFIDNIYYFISELC